MKSERRRHPQATRRQRGRAVTQRLPIKRSLASRVSREPAIEKEAMPSLHAYRGRRHCARADASPPLKARRNSTIQDRRHFATALSAQKARTDPGNTAGPVLPHRPSKTPPVLRNHREGLVTCSTVATRTEKTTPVGSLVTQRKHQRFPKPHTGCSHPSAAPGNVRSLA